MTPTPALRPPLSRRDRNIAYLIGLGTGAFLGADPVGCAMAAAGWFLWELYVWSKR